MTSTSEICIIGGGVLGLASAWRLAQSGRRVTLLERSHCGSGASTAALGALWASTVVRSSTHRLHHLSLRSMPSFCEAIQKDSGVDCGYQRCGRIEFITNPKRTEQIHEELQDISAIEEVWGIDSLMQLITQDQLNVLEPHIPIDEHSILQCHITAMLDPIQLTAGLKQACTNHGVSIHENTPVDDVIIENNTVQSIITKEQTYHAENVLITAGVWIPFLHETLHQQAPIKPVRGQGMLFKTKYPLISHIIKKDSIYLIPKGDHHIMVGSTTEMNSGFDDHVTEEGIKTLRHGAIDLLPSLQDAEVVKTWAGLRPMGMDRRPFLGQSPTIKNLYFAAGFYKTGLGMAPIASQLIHDIIHDKTIEYDISNLQPGRIPVKRKK